MIGFFIVIFISNFLSIKIIAKKIQYTQIEKLTEKETEVMSLNVAPYLYSNDIRGVYETIRSFLKAEDIVFCTVRDTTGKIISKLTKVPLISKNVTIKEKPIVYNGIKIGTLSTGFIPFRGGINIHIVFMYITILIAAIFAIMVFILFVIINKSFLNPITELSRKMEEISFEKLPEKIEIKRRDEIGNIYRSFNRMVKNLKESMAELTGTKSLFKMAKGRIVESEEKFRSIVENAEEGLVMVGDNYRITYVNRKLCEITGYTEEEIVGSDFRGLLTDKSRKLVAERYRLRRKGKKLPVRYDIQILRKDREVRDCSMSVSVIETEAGEKLSVGVLLDITEKKKLEKELFLSQKLESIGRLTGGIAHDFNNILTAISGYAELSLDEIEKDNPARADIEEILKATSSAASLTHKLLAFSRKQIIKPLTIDLNSLIKGMDKMLKRIIGEDIEFHTFLNENLWNIYMDPAGMEQVIMNLVVNARDAMPEGGELITETANIELTEEYIKKRHPVAVPGEYVMLSISDTGVGISEDIKEHIFEPFFTTKEKGKGTGLGLSTVYGIVKQNGGFVWCYSEVGQGTTFKVYIPRARGKKDKIKRENKGEFYIGGTETILIAEDNSEVRDSISKILRNYGYKVYEAKDGEEALEFAKKFKGKVDLVISDIIMPKMNGMEVAEGVKEHYPGVKILYISGYTDNVITQKGILKPGINFLQKPFTTSPLLRKVREVLES